MGYSRQAVYGFSLFSLVKAATLVLGAIKVLVVSIVLGPTTVGLFSLLSVLLGISEKLTETGINLILLRQDKIDQDLVSTAWVISIIRGMIIASIVLIGGLFIIPKENVSSITLLLAFTCLVPLVRGLINPAVILWQKNLNFNQDALYRGSVLTIDSFLAIALTIIFPSIYALIMAIIIAALYEVTYSFLRVSIKPKLQFNFSHWKRIRSHSFWLNLKDISGYLNENIDNLIVGKMIGLTSLGVYQNAYVAGHKPTVEVGKMALFSVTPILIKLKREPKRFWSASLKSIAGSTTLICLFGLPLIVYPQPIEWILGNEWLGISHLIPLMVIAGILEHVGLMLLSPLMAKGLDKAAAAIQFSQTFFITAGLIFLLPIFGLWAAAPVLIVSRIIFVMLLLFFIHQDWKHDRKH